MRPSPNWVRAGEVVKVTDGDTIVVRIDQGFRMEAVLSFRLAGLNAPERNTKDGRDATTAVHEWLLSDRLVRPASVEGLRVIVETAKNGADKYGRWLATIWRPDRPADDAPLNVYMVDSGHAVPWDGRGARPVPGEQTA